MEGITAEQERNVRHYSPWIRLQMEEWQGLIQNLQPVAYPAGSLIFQQHHRIESLYLVASGRARAALFDYTGAEHDLFIIEQGVCLGEAALLMRDVVHYTATAITDMTLYHIPAQAFLSGLAKDAALNRHVMHLMAYKQIVLENSMALHAFRSAPQRVAIMLLNLKNHYGVPQKDGSVMISIRFTHSDIAGITNASRVTVNKVFRQLKTAGIMEKAQGRYLIHRTDLLEAFALPQGADGQQFIF